jgi:WXG100 family type VII secretion target
MTAIPTPTGCPQSLRAAAAGWRDMAARLEGIVGHLDRQVRSAHETHWRGPAADAFGEQWTQLKRSVDEARPVFTLAATQLDDAADRMESGSGGTGHPDDTSGTAPAAEHTQYAMQIAYAASALSQLGPSLSAALGGRNGKRRGQARPKQSVGVWKQDAEAAHLPSGAIGAAPAPRSAPAADADAEPQNAPSAKPDERATPDEPAESAKPAGPNATNFGAFG